LLSGTYVNLAGIVAAQKLDLSSVARATLKGYQSIILQGWAFMTSIARFFAAVLAGAAFLNHSCVPFLGKSDSGNRGSAPWKPAGEVPQGFDFKKNCGVDVEEDAGNPLYAQKLQSQNIVSEGQALNMSYRVEAMANLDIQSTRGASKTTIDVKLNKVIDKSTNVTPLQSLILLIGARIASNSRAGTVETTAIPNGEWLKLTNGSNPEWKDFLCVATASRTHKLSGKAGNHTITFNPGLANAVNPMASADQYLKELGGGRSVKVTAMIDSNPRVFNGTVTFKPVSPAAVFTDALTSERRAVQADAAWEVTTQFEKGNPQINELSNVTTYYVSHAKKRFEAIVVSNTALDKPEPPVVMLPLN
jgi:hypothetical protein